MAKACYVVIVGKKIGIFKTWLDAAPFVKGVPEAVYQGFDTVEEGKAAFEKHKALGNTRVVISEDVFGSSTSRTAVRSPHSQAQTLKTNAQTNLSQTKGSRRSTSSANVLDGVRTPTPVRSMSAQSSSSRRSSAETSHHISRTHSLPSNSTTNSLSTHHRSVIPRVVVQTPMWLPAYPNGQSDATSTILSPLSENDVPLRGITSPNTSTQRQLSSRGVQSMTPRMSNPKTIPQSQTAESKNSSECFNGQLSPLSCPHCRKEGVYASHSPLPTSHVVHNPSSDPRSPFVSKGMAPMTAK